MPSENYLQYVMLLQYSLTPDNVKCTLVPIKNVFKLSVLKCYFHKWNMLSSRKINTKSMDGDSLLKEAWFNFPILFVESVARWGGLDWNMLDPWDVHYAWHAPQMIFYEICVHGWWQYFSLRGNSFEELYMCNEIHHWYYLWNMGR